MFATVFEGFLFFLFMWVLLAAIAEVDLVDRI